MKRLIYILILILTVTNCNNTDKKEEAVNTEKKSSITIADLIIVDLSYDYSNETVYWVTSKEFEIEEVSHGQTDKGYFYAANNFSTSEHGGTHIDAPIHFAENGVTVDKIPLEQLVGPAIKIDVSNKAKNNPDYLVSVEDLIDWETLEGEKIPNNCIVLLETGHGAYYPDKAKYLGTAERGVEALKDLHFPGLSPEAAEWLVNHRKIKAIGLDTPSIDYGQSTNFRSHIILMTKNIPAFENLANLDKLPTKNFQIVALPMKIKGGSGAPLRIIALLN